MKRRAYVKFYNYNSETTDANIYYNVQIVIGMRRFIPEKHQYMTKGEANRKAKEVASLLGIEAKIAED